MSQVAIILKFANIVPALLPSINFLHLRIQIQPGQTFSRQMPVHLDAMGEDNTCTALKGSAAGLACTCRYVGMLEGDLIVHFTVTFCLAKNYLN